MKRIRKMASTSNCASLTLVFYELEGWGESELR